MPANQMRPLYNNNGCHLLVYGRENPYTIMTCYYFSNMLFDMRRIISSSTLVIDSR